MTPDKTVALFGIVSIVSLVLTVAAAARAALIVDFEDLDAGTTFSEGESFETGGVVVTVDFGGGRGEADIAVGDGGEAAGSGNGIRVHGLALFEFQEPLIQAQFRFSATELRVGTGDQVSVFDLESLARSMDIDDLRVTVDASPAPRANGTITISAIRGSFDSFTLGTNRGRDYLYMDDLELVAPEPAALLSVLALGVLISRRRTRRRS